MSDSISISPKDQDFPQPQTNSSKQLTEEICALLLKIEGQNVDEGQEVQLIVDLGAAGQETTLESEKKRIRDVLLRRANANSYRVRRNALKYTFAVMKTMEYFVVDQKIDLTRLTVRRRAQIGKFLEKADNFEEYQTALDRFDQTTWKSQKEIVLKQVLKVLKEDEVSEIRQASADWLGNNAEKLVTLAENDYFTYKTIADALEIARRKAAHRAYIEDEVNSIKSAQHKLWDELYKQSYYKHLNIIKSGTSASDEEDASENLYADERTTAIFKMGEESTLGSREAIRELVEQWVKWIRDDKEPHLVEFTAETLRFNRFSVLALIEQLGKKTVPHNLIRDPQEIRQLNRKWETAAQNGSRIAKYEILAVDWCKEKFRLLNELELHELDQWLSLREEDDPHNPSAELVELVIESRKVIQNDFAKNLRVRQRIARQLADMSDPGYFEDQDATWQRIRKELRKHAVPVVARLLRTEDDPEIRESMGRMLGYTGGQEAIDTLVLAVIGDEKKRTERQDLLTEHYLEPARDRSQQAANILQGAIDEAKQTIRILQTMNIATLIVGLSIVVVGILISMTNESPGLQALGGLSSVGGFGWVIFQLVNAPLDRIQNAMANLVQLETAFINYIWELNLNGTYIQSRYVSEGKLQSDEIKSTTERIEKSMQLTMNLVARHTEEGTHQQVTRINKIEPAAGSSKEEITLHGQYLVGDIKQKKERNGMVGINHQLASSKCIAAWDEYQVKVKLSEISLANGVIWISLFVDGMETNALPYHVQA
ncbi:MAG: hypothetical protein H6636_08325 [Anaerolineales bacterium]|nr:hypothetical protein [Anaerolineales bacterium]